MQEKRRYVRMNTVFPVEFEILTGNAGKGSPGLSQGFTRDVSEGGMCIEYKTFAKHEEAALNASGVSLGLTINPTFSVHPIKATASVVWLKKEVNSHSQKYWIGVAYQTIDDAARRRLIRHAKRSVWVPRAAMAAAAALVLLLGVLWAHDQRLTSENRRLVAQLQTSAEKKSSVSQHLRGLDERKKHLDRELVAAGGQSEDRQQKIRQEIEKVRQNEKKLQDIYRRLEEQEKGPTSAVLDQMFEWLKSHQNLRTGLVASFEGDPALEDAAFTYDQALAAQVFLLFGDRANAAAVLDFYDRRARQQSGVFFNGYETVGGVPLESTVHVGPNVWLGIAALQYEHRVKDGRFLPLAKKIADWLLHFQDPEGGLRGGPAVTWYSTEHNLDAYAFLGLLHRQTGDEKYRQAQERLEAWIQKYAYSVKDGRMRRGKGDSTIATDTFDWAIAAIGPVKLKQMRFDPEGILDFAERNCAVSVEFRRPDGKTIVVRGFDFSKAQNVGRGGVISTEWTAQMAVTYQVMANYYRSAGDTAKAAEYLQKSNFTLSELQKMLITSPSRTGQGRGCLPYASADNVDTGHGWRTPKGARTGSVAGTAYGIFAWKGYNPFEWEDADAGVPKP